MRTEARHCSHCGGADHSVKSCPQLHPEAAARRLLRLGNAARQEAKVRPGPHSALIVHEASGILRTAIFCGSAASSYHT